MLLGGVGFRDILFDIVNKQGTVVSGASCSVQLCPATAGKEI